MTSQQPQIQSLIDQIDRVLNKTNPRLPWVMSGDMTQQRQVLEQARSYLVGLQRQLPASDPYSQGGFAADPAYSQYPSYPQGQSSFPSESPQQVLQAVLQEMNYLRRNMMQPLRTEVDQLQQQKAALTQEIRQLEAQRQQYALPQQSVDRQFIAEYLQTAINRLQENLSRQMAQQIQPELMGQPSQGRSLPEATDVGDMIVNPSALSPSQQLDWLRNTDTQTDEMLLQLDSTLRTVFESLLRDVRSYQDSLQQELQKMHNLGQQGEALFAALLSRLAQQLGREASSYVQSFDPTSVTDHDPSLQDRSRQSLQPSASDDISDDEIDQLLDELTSGEGTPTTPPAQPDTPLPSPYTGSQNLDLLGLDLENLELETPDIDMGSGGLDDDDVTLFQQDEPPTPVPMDDDDITLFQVENDDDITQFQVADEESFEPEGLGAIADTGIGDLDSAFDLLNQLNIDTAGDESLLEGSSLRQMGLQPTPPDDDEDLTLPSDNQDLDELYESIFGSTGIGQPDVIGSTDADQPDADETGLPFEQPIAEAEAADFSQSTYESEPVAEPVTPLGDALFGDSTEPVTEPVTNQDVDLDPAIENWLFGDREVPLDDSAPFADPLIEAEMPTFGEPTDASGTVAPETDTPEPVAESVTPLDDDLFSDLPETTQPELGLADRLAAMQTPQSAEDFLFSIDEPAFSQGAATTPVGDPLAADATPYPEVPDDVDAIAALSDLISPPESSPELAAPQPAVDQPVPDEDSYIPAAPDEDLLGTGDPLAESRLDLRLAADTLQQLTADLSSLEGLEIEDAGTPPAPAEETNWTLDQWTETAQPLPETPPLTEPEQVFEQAITTPPTDTNRTASEVPIGTEEVLPESSSDQPLTQAEPDIFALDDQFGFEDMEVSPEEPSEQTALTGDDTELFLEQNQFADEGTAIPDVPSDDALLEELFSSFPEADVQEPTATAEGMMDDESGMIPSISDATLEALLAEEPTADSSALLDDATLEGLFSDDLSDVSEPSSLETPSQDEANFAGDFLDSDISEPYQSRMTPDDPDFTDTEVDRESEGAIAADDVQPEFFDSDISQPFQTAADDIPTELLDSDVGQPLQAAPEDISTEFLDFDFMEAFESNIELSEPELTISGFGRELEDVPDVESDDDLFSIPELEESPLPSSEPQNQESSLTLEDFGDLLTTDAPAETASPEQFAGNLFEDFPADPSAPAPSTDPGDRELTLTDFAAESPDPSPSAFTLEGLDNLFEDLPDVPLSSEAEAASGSETEPDAMTLDDVFGVSTPEASPTEAAPAQNPFFMDTETSGSESLEKKNNSGGN